MGNKLRTLMPALVVGAAAAVLIRSLRSKRRESFAGKTVVITGGSRGLGLAMARVFASEHAHLVLIARSNDQLQSAAVSLAAQAASVRTIVCDVRDRAQVQQSIDAIVAERGSIDVMVNNAGVMQVTPFLHAQPADFEDSLNTHFWGPYFVIEACLPHLRRQHGGAIVNISSIGGRIGVPHMIPYCVGKFALAGFSDALHAELKPLGITVTTVTPFLMRTGSHRNVVVRGQHHEEAAWFALGTATPLTAMSANRAALQIVEGVRQGRARISPGWPGRAAQIAGAIAPELMSAASVAVVRAILPAPDGAEGDRARTSRDLDLGNLAKRFATAAAVNLNQRIAADERRVNVEPLGPAQA